MFGFSLGGRIVIEAALNLGLQIVENIDGEIHYEQFFFQNLNLF
jgi:hypothetical protein